MADIDFDDYGGGTPRVSSGQVQRLVNLAGAASSIALIVGLGIWGYRLAVRDVSGIPVIRAVEGPMRVAPDNPGGSVADHQGMAINVIAEVGTTEEMPEEIVLAPAPVQLEAEDTAGLAALSANVEPAPLVPRGPGPMPLEAFSLAPVEVAAPVGVMPEVPAFDPAALQVPAPGATDEAVAMALAEALASGSEPLSADPVSADTATLTEDAAVPQGPALAEDAGDGLARSPIPRARPDGLRAAVASSAPAVGAPSAPLTAEIDPASLSRGTRLVQLGAFDSVDLARGEWTRLSARFGDLMTGKAPVIEAAESGGRTFYRLRAHGFAGEDDVRRFCAALVAEDAACIPATVR